MNGRYYLKIALRNLIREKKYSFFLFFSLFIGLLTFILVSGYVFYEKGYDRVFPDNKNIYRVTTDIYNANELKISIPQCERGVASSVKGKYPDIMASGYLTKPNNPQYKIGEEIFSNNHIYHASPEFMDVFSIPLVQGNRSGILTKPYTAIISESTARKYFGSQNPVGQILFKYPVYEYTIEGVFQDIPKQSHFSAEVLLSFHDDMHLPPPAKAQWGETGFYTYLKVKANADIRKLETGINNLVAENKKGFFEKNNVQHRYLLQPLRDIHLHSDLKHELSSNSNAEYIHLVLLIGVLILMASGFNFIQFSISRLINTAKNVGVRKINGADNSSIILLSLAKSVFIHLAATIFSMATAWLVIPVLQNRLGVTIESVFSSYFFWAMLVAVVLMSAIINGILPAVIISRYNSLQLLKLKYKPVSGKFSFRQAIVVTQFIIIIAIISGIAGMNKQVNFLVQKDKGFDAENTLVLKVPQNIRKTSERIDNLEAFEQELLTNSAITGISSSNRVPGDLPAYNFNFTEIKTSKGGKAAALVADNNFIGNYKIDLLAGRNFSATKRGGLNNLCIVNSACLPVLGIQHPVDALGRVLKMKDESGMQNFEVSIIGVSENVDFSDAKGKHEPIILLDWTKEMLWGNYSIKLAHSDFASVVPFIKEKFHATFPNYPFEYLVLEDHYNKQFEKENQLIQIFQLFIFIAVLISTINLFAISWLISSARIKEIGIRKVNGAKVSEILTMLNKDFVKWVVVAFVIASPISYYAMNKWLENFAYKTELSWWVFALAGLLALGIALMTVSWQSWKAATRNPVEALRYE